MNQISIHFREVPENIEFSKVEKEVIEHFLQGKSLMEMHKETGWGYNLLVTTRQDLRAKFEVDNDTHLAIALYANGYAKQG